MAMTMTLASSQSTVTEQLPDKPRQAPDEGHWREIIGQIGTEVGLPLSAALERVTVLATTGKIDRAGLRMLREEIERARRAGMIGQQLARFASGRIRQSPEQVNVTQMLREVLLQRGREATARQIEISQALKPAEVVVDATLLHALLQAVVDWSLDLAQGILEFKVDVKAWPPYARLTVHFKHGSSDASDRLTPVGTPLPSLDSMAWRLVQQISWTLGLVMDRTVSKAETTLTVEFPRTIHDEIEGVSVVEIDQGFGVSDNSKPLAGSHVLVVAGGREMRSLIKESIRHMGLLVDFVNSVEEAEEFCRDALPHAIIYESVLANDRFHRLHVGISSEIPTFVFIEVTPEGNALQLSTGSKNNGARIGREAVMQSLPSALIFELSRTI
jgi:hypothetical protein